MAACWAAWNKFPEQSGVMVLEHPPPSPPPRPTPSPPPLTPQVRGQRSVAARKAASSVTVANVLSGCLRSVQNEKAGVTGFVRLRDDILILCGLTAASENCAERKATGYLEVT